MKWSKFNCMTSQKLWETFSSRLKAVSKRSCLSYHIQFRHQIVIRYLSKLQNNILETWLIPKKISNVTSFTTKYCWDMTCPKDEARIVGQNFLWKIFLKVMVEIGPMATTNLFRNIQRIVYIVLFNGLVWMVPSKLE